jgi:hypothetical protein
VEELCGERDEVMGISKSEVLARATKKSLYSSRKQLRNDVMTALVGEILILTHGLKQTAGSVVGCDIVPLSPFVHWPRDNGRVQPRPRT